MAACDVDCEAGRALGCKTFCCRLLVRLAPEEREAPKDGVPARGFVDKDPQDGLCVHLDRGSHRCGVWATRPKVCREYHCNDDEMLIAAVRAEKVVSIVELAKVAARLRVTSENRVCVPLVGEREDG